MIFVLIITLFAFWLLLSQKFDVMHVSIGFICSIGIGLYSHYCLHIQMPIKLYLTRMMVYLPWLFWQIVLANICIARVVLHPQLPIQPTVIRFSTNLDHVLARLVLANSITLTPGTFTINVSENEFLIHALTKKDAEQLLPNQCHGELINHVKKIFEKNV